MLSACSNRPSAVYEFARLPCTAMKKTCSPRRAILPPRMLGSDGTNLPYASKGRCILEELNYMDSAKIHSKRPEISHRVSWTTSSSLTRRGRFYETEYPRPSELSERIMGLLSSCSGCTHSATTKTTTHPETTSPLLSQRSRTLTGGVPDITEPLTRRQVIPAPA